MSKYNVKKLYASKNRTILLEEYFIWIRGGGYLLSFPLLTLFTNIYNFQMNHCFF